MAAFPLAAYLGVQQGRVSRLLEDRLTFSAAPARLVEAMRYCATGGGKRLRAILCLASADAVAGQSGGGGALSEDAACALELVHAYSLVHDDLPAMDDSPLRRGKPSAHVAFGEAMAILAGDALLTVAFELLSKGPAEESVSRLALVHELSAAAGADGMVGGQVLDISAERAAELVTLERMHRMKTGALIRASCRMGAIAAGAPVAALAAVTRYGEAVGLAFQIADDLLDATATTKQLGKPAAADAKRATFATVLGVEEAKQAAQAQMQQALEAIRFLEPAPGPLAALARYAVERSS